MRRGHASIADVQQPTDISVTTASVMYLLIGAVRVIAFVTLTVIVVVAAAGSVFVTVVVLVRVIAIVQVIRRV